MHRTTKKTSDLVVGARLQAGDANPDGNAHGHEARKQAPAVAAAVEGAQLPQRPEAQKAQPRCAPRRVACAEPQLKYQLDSILMRSTLMSYAFNSNSDPGAEPARHAKHNLQTAIFLEYRTTRETLAALAGVHGIRCAARHSTGIVIWHPFRPAARRKIGPWSPHLVPSTSVLFFIMKRGDYGLVRSRRKLRL